MGMGRTTLSAVLAASLAACGGGGSNPAPPTSGGGATPTPSPTPTSGTAGCSLAARQNFVFEQLDMFYLFPELLDKTVNRSAFSDVQSYIDALVAPARAQSKDRGFTFITSIQEENAFFNSGSSAGFGIRLGYDTASNRVFVIEAFENAPGFAGGFDRGVEILAVGSDANSLQTTEALLANGGPANFSEALGTSDPGVTRTFRIRERNGTERVITIVKAEFELDPISDRYGAQIINDNGKKVGYVNLRTFIDTSEQNLRNAFATFRAQGVTEVIVDVRYNGGGLVRIAELFGDLLGADKVGQVFSRTVFRPSLSENSDTELFESQPQAIGATKIAFIGTRSTASASELVANAFIPYLGNNTALVGSNTFGKPVGQIARDKSECDDRLRVLAFKTENANGQGEYFTGLASVFPQTCRAADDIFNDLGSPQEASVAAALDFLAGRSCTPISGTQGTQGVRSAGQSRQVLQPENPTRAQREVPGLY